jgi:hypothetical protein
VYLSDCLQLWSAGTDDENAEVDKRMPLSFFLLKKEKEKKKRPSER